MSEYAIKVRRPGAPRWYFLGSGGRLTWLRIHADRYSDRSVAQRVIDDSRPDNPPMDWKVVRLGR